MNIHNNAALRFEVERSSGRGSSSSAVRSADMDTMTTSDRPVSVSRGSAVMLSVKRTRSNPVWCNHPAPLVERDKRSEVPTRLAMSHEAVV